MVVETVDFSHFTVTLINTCSINKWHFYMGVEGVYGDTWSVKIVASSVGYLHTDTRIQGLVL